MKSIDSNICTTLWVKQEKIHSKVSTWDKIHHIFSEICNYDARNKMQVLEKTLNLYDLYDLIRFNMISMI